MPKAPRSGATRAAPFLRWAGAKGRHVPHIIARLGTSTGTYYEAFLGSGAVFFALSPPKAVLGDTVEPLIRTFRAVRDGPKAVMTAASQWSVDRDTYYSVRDLQPENRYEAAAKFIYLNKTCW